MNQSRFYNSDRHDRSLQSTPSRQYSGTPESSPLSISSETPSSSHSRHNAMASNISLVQDQLNTILRKLDQTNERLDNLTERIEKIEKDTSEDNVEAQKNTKRKRTKDSLTVQVFYVIFKKLIRCQIPYKSNECRDNTIIKVFFTVYF